MWKMSIIKLIEPDISYAEEIWGFRREIIDSNDSDEDKFSGCQGLDECESAEEWLEKCELIKSEKTCKTAGVNVPSNTYLAVKKDDNKLVGIIDLRHHINHPILGTWGGHCGYSVRPSERRKGYATEMLRLNLQNAKALGISKFLVTCAETNIASEKTILSNGGIFENTIEVNGIRIKRFWIEIEVS